MRPSRPIPIKPRLIFINSSCASEDSTRFFFFLQIMCALHDNNILTEISDLEFGLAHRTLLPPSTQRIRHYTVPLGDHGAPTARFWLSLAAGKFGLAFLKVVILESWIHFPSQIFPLTGSWRRIGV